MSDKPKVFITQYSDRLNFAEAADYGDVIFLTQSEFQPNPSPPNVNEQITHEIGAALDDYIPGFDYIVLTGSSIPNLIVGSMLKAAHAPHKLLKWSNRMSGYETFILHL